MPSEAGHVEQKHVLHFALEHAATDASADGDDFVRSRPGVLLMSLCAVSPRAACGHATDEHEFVNLAGAMPGVLQAGVDGLDGALEQAVRELFHLWRG